MPVNFNTLKTSEDALRKLFLKFFSHVLQSQEYLFTKFEQDYKLSQLQYNVIANREKKANQFEAQILDETSWIISKDQPRAAHLRYIIAIIRSIKDLERMGDFVERVAGILYKQKNIDEEIAKILCKLMEGSLLFAKEIYRNINSGSHQTKAYYVKASEKFYAFSDKYRVCFKEAGEKIFRSRKDLRNKLAIFTAIKNIERNADHAFNILENFVYIGQPDFYFKKESR